ncbi:MAG: SMP-30/gluconolactonase/LRE family protein [Novosphingobium sp.]
MSNLVVSDWAPLAKGIYLEGLAVDERRVAVWYSDVIAGGVRGLMSDGGTLSLNPERKWTGGVIVNADGRVLSSGAGGIMWNNPEDDTSGWLIDTIDGAPINGINEMAADAGGALYFGTADLENIEKGEPPRPAAIYRLTLDRQAIQVADGLGFANGLMLSDDGSRLYYNDTFDGTYVFDVRRDGTLSERRRLLAKEDCDGMVLDAEGNLLLTGFHSGHLLRVGPDGSELGRIDTPADAITQVRFGGADLRDLYVCTVPADGGDNLKDGILPTEERSILYRGRGGIAGQRLPAPRFALP